MSVCASIEVREGERERDHACLNSVSTLALKAVLLCRVQSSLLLLTFHEGRRVSGCEGLDAAIERACHHVLGVQLGVESNL